MHRMDILYQMIELFEIKLYELVKKMKTYIKRILRVHIKSIITNFILIGLLAILVVYRPIIVEKFIVELTENKDFKVLCEYTIFYVLITVTVFAVGYLGNILSKGMALKMTEMLKCILVDKVLSYDNRFYQKYNTGEMIELLEDDIDKLYDFFSDTLIQLCINILTLIGTVYVIYNMNPFMGIIFLAFWGIVYMVIYAMNKKDESPIYVARNMKSKVSGFYGEIYDSKMEICGYKKKNNIFKKLDTKLEKLKCSEMESQKYLYRIWILVQTMYYISIALVFFGGGMLVNKRLITVGQVYLIYSYCNLLKSPIEELQYHYQNFATALGSIRRLKQVFEYKTEVSDGKNMLKNQIKKIYVCNVSHIYNDVKVLNNAELEITAGNKVIILGKSGAGKSTLAKLISKMEELQDGNIYFDEYEIKSLKIESVKQQVLYITADPQIFPAKLIDNITLFNPNIPKDMLVHWLEELDICNTVNCLKGKKIDEALDTVIDEQCLSEGEKQLINVCRMFFTKRSVYILDEAMGKITDELEERLWRLIDDFTSDSIVIYITHNSKRLRSRNNVYKLTNGNLNKNISNIKECI